MERTLDASLVPQVFLRRHSNPGERKASAWSKRRKIGTSHENLLQKVLSQNPAYLKAWTGIPSKVVTSFAHTIPLAV